MNSRRPYQGVGNITYYAPLINSTYHALIAKLEKRFAKGLGLLASYTVGHSIGGEGNEHDTNDPAPQNVRNLAAEKGSSNFDVRHCIALSGSYQPPFGRKSGFAPYLIRDWQLSGIFSAQTGQPFTATLSTDPSGTGSTARPNRISDGNLPQASAREPSGLIPRHSWSPPASALAAQAGISSGDLGSSIWISRSSATFTSLSVSARSSAPNRSIS